MARGSSRQNSSWRVTLKIIFGRAFTIIHLHFNYATRARVRQPYFCARTAFREIILPPARPFPCDAPMTESTVPPIPADKLETIFSLQDGLNRRIGVNTAGLSEPDQTKWILNYTRAMQQELAELTDSVPWKWWAKYQKFDQQNARVEVVDLFHFLVSLAQVLGMSADDIYQAYLKKNLINHQRQDSGYVVKNENDSRSV
jgi:dimeric dUTPase (all-alpha-NTP-PPase superfamily)